MSDVIQKIENMVRMEESHASSLTASVDGIENDILKKIIRSIAFDSQKHAGFFSTILSLLRGQNQTITEQDYARIESILKKHIETEDRMTVELKDLLEAEQDTRVKLLLTEILEDELWHHGLMMRLLEGVINREPIFERQLWGSIFAGAPE